MATKIDITPYYEFAVDVAWRAGRLTLEYFQTNLEITWKSDNSPVTVADQRAEELIRQLIEARYPSHTIVGEEMGESARTDNSFRWIVDPIDGTRSFMRGVPLYAVLLGLEIEGQMVVGVANFPALGEMLAAGRGQGCWWNGRRARVSTVDRLDQALLCYTDASGFAPQGRAAAWSRLQATVHTQRGWSDAYGYALVATGRAEIMLDPIMNLWDCAALLPILEEAGGTFTDWNGTPTAYGNNAIATNGHLLPALLTHIQAATTIP